MGLLLIPSRAESTHYSSSDWGDLPVVAIDRVPIGWVVDSVKTANAESALAFQVTTIDSTGAGDCFLGAFAAALMPGESEFCDCQFAAAGAALSVTRHGAQASVPEFAAVQHLLATTNALEPYRVRTNA